ncbi:uncharacterized [Tachysurus ichikawai]
MFTLSRLVSPRLRIIMQRGLMIMITLHGCDIRTLMKGADTYNNKHTLALGSWADPDLDDARASTHKHDVTP